MPDLIANWPAPPNISALTTKRTTGHSIGPYAGNNFGLHVQDNPEHVLANRRALRIALNLPNEPEWLEQTHSTQCVLVEEDSNRCVDAAISRSPQHVLAIMTGDCLPILICNKQGSEIAAIHAGWRGLVNGIVENTIAKMHSNPADLLAWIGPAICHSCYQVGNEVRETFLHKHPTSASFFTPFENKWQANLPQIAEKILNKTTVFAVYQSNECTFEQKNEYYSYRREPQTGRMVSLIWLNETYQD